MGKWAARLAEKVAVPHHVGTDETAKRGLVSVLAVSTKGGAFEIRAAPMLEGKAVDKLQAVDLSAVAWTEADIARFLDRRSRLLRWGWPESEAENLAERLVKSDRDNDDRVSCIDCKHYRPGRCGNHRRAGLHAPDVGRDLATMLQRCPGYVISGTP